MLDCECKTWAVSDATATLLGNGHHQNCYAFAPDVGAMALLRELVRGIRWWAAQEDGVPDEVWEAYKKAVWITEGRMIDERRD